MNDLANPKKGITFVVRYKNHFKCYGQKNYCNRSYWC